MSKGIHISGAAVGLSQKQIVPVPSSTNPVSVVCLRQLGSHDMVLLDSEIEVQEKERSMMVRPGKCSCLFRSYLVIGGPRLSSVPVQQLGVSRATIRKPAASSLGIL